MLMRAAELFGEGLTVREVAATLRISKSEAGRLRIRAMEDWGVHHHGNATAHIIPRRRLLILGLLIVCPLLVAGFVISMLYVLGEQKDLRNGAIATVRDAATTVDDELRPHLLVLQIISTSVDVSNGSFERVYRQAKQLSDTISGSVVSLRRENGDVIFKTPFPLGTRLESEFDPTYLHLRNSA
jgi:hypothetical protein